jgi:glyoxylase-like metal-dependent hydrolase (beta-lactamase superfamily II)
MSILYKKIVVGELAANCYLCWNERTKECLIVDPGDDGVGISEEIEALGLIPTMVAVTHGHFDHSLAALDLKLIYGIPFGCSSKDEFLLKRQSKTAEYFLKRKTEIPEIKIDTDLDKIKKIKLGEEEIRIIKTPGHTPGGVCLYSANNKLLFSGDTLFENSRGRTDFSYASTEDIMDSIGKIMKLAKETLVLPGHGENFVLGENKVKI